jgi:tetratricopeptide (TPR) repeat protein
MYACSAADQAGVSLQHVSRYPEAIKAHQRAVKLARREGLVSLLEGLLNNLGEAQRHLGRYDDAEASLKEAEAIAAVHDEESTISIAHNRALVVQDKGDHAGAETLFKQCRDRSRSKGFWREYVRAIEALANLACLEQQYVLSKRRYVQAIQYAKIKRASDLLPRLSLNYAHLELFLGNPNVAIRQMRNCMKQVANQPDEHLFHYVSGRAYSDTNMFTNAVEHLTIAASLAVKVGDKEQQLLALGALADVYENNKRHAEAIDILQTVIDAEEDIESKVWAMIQLVRVKLEFEDDSAQSTYNTAMQLINRYKLHEASVDLHMTLGQHTWINDDKDRLQALQAFTFAYITALINDIENKDEERSVAGEAGAAILRLLTSPQTCVPQQELESLFAELKDWVNKNFSSNGIREFALTIFRWSIELLPLNSSPKKLSDRLNQLVKRRRR